MMERSKEYLQEVATIILQQLKANPIELIAWGAKNFCFLERTIGDKSYPALRFSIRTPLVRAGGRVIISYDEGCDSYIVEAIRVRAGKETLLGKVEDVHCFELHDIINSLIEDEESYKIVAF